MSFGRFNQSVPIISSNDVKEILNDLGFGQIFDSAYISVNRFPDIDCASHQTRIVIPRQDLSIAFRQDYTAFMHRNAEIKEITLEQVKNQLQHFLMPPIENSQYFIDKYSNLSLTEASLRERIRALEDTNSQLRERVEELKKEAEHEHTTTPENPIERSALFKAKLKCDW